MPALRRPIAAFVLVALAGLAGADEGVVRAPFEATDRGGNLQLEGKRVPVALETYRRYQRTLDDLRAGDRVEYELDAEGRLTSIRERIEATNPNVERLPVIGKYQSLEKDPVLDFYWLRIDGQGYQVSPEVYQAESRDLLFLNPGDRIRIEIEQNWVVSVEKNVEDVAINQEILDLIQASEKDDTVFINGSEFRFVRHGEDTIELNPRLPNGKIEREAKVRFKLRDVQSYRNDAAVARMRHGSSSGGSTNEGDVFDTESVRVGDTIGIELQDGQVIDLSPETVTLKLWKSERWSGEQTWERSAVQAVRRIKLSTQQSVPLGPGHVQVRVQRWRHASASGLGFRIEVSHNLESSLLVGVKIRLHLGNAAMDVTDPAVSVEEVEVPDLFANDLVVVEHAVTDDQYQDGRVELLAGPDNAVPITSPKALPNILKAIARAGARPERLGQVYVAAGLNGEASLVKLLIDRAIYPPGEEPSVKLRNGDLAVGGLRKTADAAKVIIQQLSYMERAMKRTVLAGDVTREETLDRYKIDPDDHKRRLARLLGKLPGGLSNENGERLFDIYLTRASLGMAIEEAFGERPDEAVGTLLKVATSLNSASSGDEEARADRATKLLMQLGEKVVNPLMVELRTRGIDVKELQTYRETAGVPASDVVKRALAFLIEFANAQRRAELNRRVDEAQLLEAEGKWEEALRAVRAVLAQEPQHERALERLPSILLETSDARRRDGDRGGAAKALEQALKALPPAQASRAKNPLAQLYLEALAEEAEGVVIRDAPHRAATKLQVGANGQGFPGIEVDNDWVELQLGQDKTGYVRSKLVNPGNGNYVIAYDETPYAKIFKPLLEELRAMAPTQKAKIDELEGGLILSEAMKKYEGKEYQNAVALFDQAEELVPGDDRLSTAKWAWFHANAVYLGGAAGLVALVVVIGAMQMFARPKKVKFEGEFRHYGAERAQRERGLDLEGGAPPPGEELE